MKKIITAVFCTALALNSGLTAYAAEVPDRESLETAMLMQSSRDYQVAVESSNLNAVGSIGNLLRMQAQRAVYDTMIYLWRDK